MKVWRLLSLAGHRFLADNVPQLGAALAFYAALSLAPLVAILMMAVGFVFGAEAARGQVSEQLRVITGDEASQAIEQVISGASGVNLGTGATIMSLATLLLAASAGFSELQRALSTIWRVEYPAGRGILDILRGRLLSFVAVVVIAALLLALSAASVTITAFDKLIEGVSERIYGSAQMIESAASLAIVTVLFAILFKLLPDVRVAWRDVWFGAAVTAVLFTLGRVGIGIYLAHSNLAVSYGVANSFVALLIWIYYSAQIVLFGAELTHVYASTRTSLKGVGNSTLSPVPDRSAT